MQGSTQNSWCHLLVLAAYARNAKMVASVVTAKHRLFNGFVNFSSSERLPIQMNAHANFDVNPTQVSQLDLGRCKTNLHDWLVPAKVTAY